VFFAVVVSRATTSANQSEVWMVLSGSKFIVRLPGKSNVSFSTVSSATPVAKQSEVWLVIPEILDIFVGGSLVVLFGS